MAGVVVDGLANTQKIVMNMYFHRLHLVLGVLLHFNIHNMWGGGRCPHLIEPLHRRGIALDILPPLEVHPGSCCTPRS